MTKKTITWNREKHLKVILEGDGGGDSHGLESDVYLTLNIASTFTLVSVSAINVDSILPDNISLLIAIWKSTDAFSAHF